MMNFFMILFVLFFWFNCFYKVGIMFFVMNIFVFMLLFESLLDDIWNNVFVVVFLVLVDFDFKSDSKGGMYLFSSIFIRKFLFLYSTFNVVVMFIFVMGVLFLSMDMNNGIVWLCELMSFRVFFFVLVMFSKRVVSSFFFGGEDFLVCSCLMNWVIFVFIFFELLIFVVLFDFLDVKKKKKISYIL